MLDLETLRAVISEVARANRARLAVLFGSWARGTATHRSDVDLIFVEETSDPFLARLGRYFDPLSSRLESPVEVFVYTPEEFERMREGPFVGRALREGIILYESGEVPGRRKKVASPGEGGS